MAGRDSVVGTASPYELVGPGIESLWLRDLGIRPDWPWGLPKRLQNRHRVSFLRVQRPWRGVDRPSHVAPGLKKE
jgi:hypothetical protein